MTAVYDAHASLPLYFFNQISRYPRQSKKEERIRNFLIQWARSHEYETRVDRCGNCIVIVPACEQRKNRPPLALQAHMDMVCEIAPGHAHDFSTDPIVPRYEGDWVRADNTTLGADNGIGIALMLALCEDPMVTHPRLELVFTVEEETGLTGAGGLSADAITARHLLNLDSEDDAVLINGCAGGVSMHMSKEYVVEPEKKIASLDGAHSTYVLTLTGFAGGHSGVDIDKPLGNALCCGARVMQALLTQLPRRCYIGPLKSGTVHNAIPREFQAWLLFTDADAVRRAERIVTDAIGQYRVAHELNDDIARFVFSPCADTPFTVRSPESSAAISAFLTALPHGVASVTANRTIPRTSSNVAHISSEHERDSILLSIRSSDSQELAQFTADIAALAAAHGMKYSKSGEYPAWHAQKQSDLLEACMDAYKQANGNTPRVEVIHAGLETAIIRNTIPNLDMLSCGPLILNPHSPQERLSIRSTANIYRMLVRLLRDW